MRIELVEVHEVVSPLTEYGEIELSADGGVAHHNAERERLAKERQVKVSAQHGSLARELGDAPKRKAAIRRVERGSAIAEHLRDVLGRSR